MENISRRHGGTTDMRLLLPRASRRLARLFGCPGILGHFGRRGAQLYTVGARQLRVLVLGHRYRRQVGRGGRRDHRGDCAALGDAAAQHAAPAGVEQRSQALQPLAHGAHPAAEARVGLGVESEEGLQLSPGIVEAFHGVALSWHRGYSLGGLLRRIDLAEGDLLVTLNQTIDLLQQVQGAVGQVLDARDLWRDVQPDTRFGRWMGTMRERLERLRPLLDAGWRGMLRGSVAQSRAIPSMVAAPPAPDLPPIPMAEDEDPELARSDRVELGIPPAEMPADAGPTEDAGELPTRAPEH